MSVNDVAKSAEGADVRASTDTAQRFLVARPDGSMPRVLRAVSAEGAILARFKDDEDVMLWGNIATKLGNYPTQYEATADENGIVLRELGNPRV